jgi:hypothetical protein
MCFLSIGLLIRLWYTARGISVFITLIPPLWEVESALWVFCTHIEGMSLFSHYETVGSSHYYDKRPSSFSDDRIFFTIRCNAVMSVTISPQLLQLLGTGWAHNIWSLVISAVASALGLLLALLLRRPLWPNQPGRKVAPSWYLGTRRVFLPLRLVWVAIPAVTASKLCLVWAVLWNSDTMLCTWWSGYDGFVERNWVEPSLVEVRTAEICSLNKTFITNKKCIVRFEVSTAVTMMIIIFSEMTPCGSYKNRLESPPIQELTVSLCTCSHSFTLKLEAIRSSETSVLIRATRRHLPEDDNHQEMHHLTSRCSAWGRSHRADFTLTEQSTVHTD